MVKKVCVCPDLDIMQIVSKSIFVDTSEYGQHIYRKKHHEEMNKNLECHIYNDVKYCFCSLKSKVR